MADDLVQPQGVDGPVYDAFADKVLDHLWRGINTPAYEAACNFASDREAAYAALARKDAEIAELRRTIAQDHEATLLRDRALKIASEKCVAAESQLAALRERVERAPVVEADKRAELGPEFGNMAYSKIALKGELAMRLGGKCVALVALEE